MMTLIRSQTPSHKTESPQIRIATVPGSLIPFLKVGQIFRTIHGKTCRPGLWAYGEGQYLKSVPNFRAQAAQPFASRILPDISPSPFGCGAKAAGVSRPEEFPRKNRKPHGCGPLVPWPGPGSGQSGASFGPGDDWDDLSASMVADIVDQPLEAIFSHRFRPQRWLNHKIKTKCGWVIPTP